MGENHHSAVLQLYLSDTTSVPAATGLRHLVSKKGNYN